MDFSQEDKVLIKVWHQEKGCRSKKFMKEIPNKNFCFTSVNVADSVIQLSGSVKILGATLDSMQSHHGTSY